METATVSQHVDYYKEYATVHNLTNFKDYPVVHRWLVNRNVFSITANRPILFNEIIKFAGKKYRVLKNYHDKTPRPAIRENVMDGNLLFVTMASTYYEFLTEPVS